MEFTISISEDKKYLIMNIFEPITGEMGIKMIQEATKEIKKHNIRKVFADMSRVKNISNMPDKYDLAYSEASRAGFPRETKLAIFVSLYDHSHDFIETVLINAGYICSIFHNKVSAMEWLNT